VKVRRCTENGEADLMPWLPGLSRDAGIREEEPTPVSIVAAGLSAQSQRVFGISRCARLARGLARIEECAGGLIAHSYDLRNACIGCAQFDVDATSDDE
jgi:hypothetical protein